LPNKIDSMTWSFKKRKKIAPGVHLNFSKKGVSTSFGVKGFSITMGKRGAYLNTSIPGTGLYSRQKLGNETRNSSTEAPETVNYTKTEQKKDRVKVLLRWLMVLNMLAFIGGVLLYFDDKETFSSTELFSTIFCAIISVVCIIGLKIRQKKTLQETGKEMGQNIVNAVQKEATKQKGRVLGHHIVKSVVEIEKEKTKNETDE